MIQNTLLPFDTEDTLNAILNMPSLRDLYKNKIRNPFVTMPSVSEINLTDKVVINDLWDGMEVDQMKALFNLLLKVLPQNTINRKHISSVVIEPIHWFKQGATHENLFDSNLFPLGPLTTRRDEAASEYSLPWGMANMEEANPYKTNITMYMTVRGFPSTVLDLYLAYTFFHEIGHVFSDAAYYSLYYAKKFLGMDNLADKRNAYTFTLPNGDQISGNEYVASFAALIEKYGPFGQYTAGYKREDDEELWLRESFADATAAYFTGFMMYPEKNFAPLHPEVQQYMHDFYHAVATITRN